MLAFKRRAIAEPSCGHPVSSLVKETQPSATYANAWDSHSSAEPERLQIPISPSVPSPTFIRPGPSRATSSRSNSVPDSEPPQSSSKRLSTSSSALTALRSASSSFVSLLSLSRASTPTRTTFDGSPLPSPVSSAGRSNVSIRDHHFLSNTTEHAQTSPSFAEETFIRPGPYRARTKQKALDKPGFVRPGPSRAARSDRSQPNLISEWPPQSGLFERRKSAPPPASFSSFRTAGTSGIDSPTCVQVYPTPPRYARPTDTIYDDPLTSPAPQTVEEFLESAVVARERRSSESSNSIAGPSHVSRRRSSSVSSVSSPRSRPQLQLTLPTSLTLVGRREPESEPARDDRDGRFFGALTAAKLRRGNSYRKRKSSRFSSIIPQDDLNALPPPVGHQGVAFGADINVMDADGRRANADPMEILRRL